MLEALGEPRAMALVGLLGGVLLGLAARLGRFCSMGAVEDALYGNDTKRLRMWGVAIGVAITGSFIAEAMGAAAITDSIYLTTAWSPVASILGGLAFGYGMALAGNCGFGALARVGGGDFRSFVIVLIMGLSAYAVLSGPLAGLRLTLFPVHSVENIPAGIAHSLGGALGISVTAIGVLIGAAILISALANRSFLQKPQMIFWAAVAGLAVL
ncbi:MAG: YeeE/YedE family protein, partial [Thalassococcus sp.]|uniref:YeeE/YedE thiosulfate transporter family protein n=1 Tax=Thalassococcus sp. TaxID=1928858 RepID=UPI001B241C46